MSASGRMLGFWVMQKRAHKALERLLSVARPIDFLLIIAPRKSDKTWRVTKAPDIDYAMSQGQHSIYLYSTTVHDLRIPRLHASLVEDSNNGNERVS